MFWAQSVPWYVCHIKSSFPGSPRNRNALMVHTHRAFVSASFKHRILYILFWTCLCLWSCPGDLSKSDHKGRCRLYFSGCRMSPSVDTRVRWKSLLHHAEHPSTAWEMRAVVPQVPPALASPFLKIDMYTDCFQSVNHRFVFRICGHILVRILTVHSLWREINLSLSQLL